MAQTGYTPILIYSSSTAAATPSAGNLTNSTLGSELAINITDGKLFYKDNANAVQVIGWKIVPTTAGGTGLTSYTAGDLMYYASGTAFTKLAIGTSGQWLGSSGTAPQWNSPAALTKTDDTNVTLTLGGSASTALLNAASLTLGWTGQLATTRGGTGLSSFTANGIVYANSTSALATGSALTFDGTNLSTTGSATATAFIPSGSSVPINGMFLPAANTVAWSTNSVQRMTLDSSTRLLIGLTSSRTNTISSASRLQVEDTSSGGSGAFIRNSNNTAGGWVIVGKSRGTTLGSFTAVQSGDSIGGFTANGADGTSMVEAAAIQVVVDNTVSTGVVPGRILFNTSSSAGSSTTRIVIESTGSLFVFQPNPAAVNTTATLTVANLQARIITSTTAAAVTGTLPTGTLMDGWFSQTTNLAVDWSVINTGATNTFTVAQGTDHTVIGNMVVNTSSSGVFRSRRTGTNTWVTYRVS